MASWLTKQRIPAAQIRVIDLHREVPLLLGWSLVYVVLSGCTAQLIRRWPLPVLGSSDFLLDYWYVLFFKVSCLLLLPLLAYWKLGYRLSDIAPQGLTARDYTWSLVAFTAGCGINSGYLPDVVHRVRESAAGNVSMPIANSDPDSLLQRRPSRGILLSLLVADPPRATFRASRRDHRCRSALYGLAHSFALRPRIRRRRTRRRSRVRFGGNRHPRIAHRTDLRSPLGPPSSSLATNRPALGNRHPAFDRRYSRTASLS